MLQIFQQEAGFIGVHAFPPMVAEKLHRASGGSKASGFGQCQFWHRTHDGGISFWAFGHLSPGSPFTKRNLALVEPFSHGTSDRLKTQAQGSQATYTT